VSVDTVGILAFPISAACFWLALHSHRGIAEARGWPTVRGRILERGIGPRMSRHSYAPHVRYTYSVGGKAYTSEQVYSSGVTGGTPAIVRRIVDKFDTLVPVHYHPQDPSRSYLLETSAAPVWIAAAFGVGALALGITRLIG
jgi:hypothetical protein